jgi:hypothetical protein
VRQALRSHPLEDARSTARAECESLTRAVLAELVADLRARDLDFFFLLFHTARTFPPGGSGDWRTRLVTGALDELDARWYDVREELARRLAQDGGTIADFYIPRDQLGGGHYDADGNAAAFAVIERGLEQTAGISAVSGGVPHPWAFETTFDDGGGTANYMRQAAPPFDRVPDKDYVVLRAPGETPLTIRYTLDGRVRRFAAKLWAYQPDGDSPSFALSASVDGRLVWERSVRPTDEVLPVELDLLGAQVLELSLAPHVFRGCAVLADPTLE